jgi:hexokinase
MGRLRQLGLPNLYHFHDVLSYPVLQRTTLPSTPFDNKLDRESINPRKQAFEKFISGMYLGEITRNLFLSLVDAAPRPILFGGKASPGLNKHYGLDTEMLSLVEIAWESEEHVAPEDALPPADADAAHETTSSDSAKPSKLEDTQLLDFTRPLNASSLKPATLHRLQRIRGVVAKHLGYEPADVSLRDAAVVRWGCALVSRRAARLSATAVATVAVQTGRVRGVGSGATSVGKNPIAIGVDGSLIQFYPRFEERMREALRLLIGKQAEELVQIGLAKDGSGVGGGCLSYIALVRAADWMCSGAVRTRRDEANCRTMTKEDSHSLFKHKPHVNKHRRCGRKTP